MKALQKMNNLERGNLLCKLFPEELENMQNLLKTKCAYFLENEIEFRKAWTQGGFFTATFWYQLVHITHRDIELNHDSLYKRSRMFVDHLFDGHRALFTQYCLIDYATSDQCHTQLKMAIHLLFGAQQILIIQQH